MLGAGKNPPPQFLFPIPGYVGEGGREKGGRRERIGDYILRKKKKKMGAHVSKRSLIFCFVFGSF